jgi:putative CocE/NonD family hydrolase
MARGPYDQRPVENRDDVILFTSNILTKPVEATGNIKARLYVSSDCPDTDFTVKISDVYPDGRSMLITDGILRMRNRNGFDHWEFMEEGKIYEIYVDLWSTSYIWNTGHRIRIAISSSNYPRFLSNPNTKEPIARNLSYNIAHNTIYIDEEHPSCLILPYIEENNNINKFNFSFSNKYKYKNLEDWNNLIKLFNF